MKAVIIYRRKRLNPITTGLFRGSVSLGGGSKGPPSLFLNYKRYDNETWQYCRTMYDEHFPEEKITLTSAFF